MTSGMDSLRSRVPDSFPVQGAGLGLRSEFLYEFIDEPPSQVDFLEVAPENWVGVGGARGKVFRRYTERFPMICHGLSLSVGGPAPLDTDYLKRLKGFLDDHDIACYTEHLSYAGDDGLIYDLMPIPFTDDAVHWVADRIKQVQDILERRIGVENVSYYAAPGQQLSESEFVNAVIAEADCGLHLDINNIYVNSINHRYDPYEFLFSLPADRIMYAHIAGHYVEAEDIRVDTHGEDVIPDVWKMLDAAYHRWGVFPTLLERDFNIPPLSDLLNEVDMIVERQQKHAEADERVA